MTTSQQLSEQEVQDELDALAQAVAVLKDVRDTYLLHRFASPDDKKDLPEWLLSLGDPASVATCNTVSAYLELAASIEGIPADELPAETLIKRRQLVEAAYKATTEWFKGRRRPEAASTLEVTCEVR